MLKHKHENVVTELLARCGETALLEVIIHRTNAFSDVVDPQDLLFIFGHMDDENRAVIRLSAEPRRLIFDRDFGWGWYNSEGPEE